MSKFWNSFWGDDDVFVTNSLPEIDQPFTIAPTPERNPVKIRITYKAGKAFREIENVTSVSIEMCGDVSYVQITHQPCTDNCCEDETCPCDSFNLYIDPAIIDEIEEFRQEEKT